MRCAPIQAPDSTISIPRPARLRGGRSPAASRARSNPVGGSAAASSSHSSGNAFSGGDAAARGHAPSAARPSGDRRAIADRCAPPPPAGSRSRVVRAAIAVSGSLRQSSTAGINSMLRRSSMIRSADSRTSGDGDARNRASPLSGSSAGAPASSLSPASCSAQFPSRSAHRAAPRRSGSRPIS